MRKLLFAVFLIVPGYSWSQVTGFGAEGYFGSSAVNKGVSLMNSVNHGGGDAFFEGYGFLLNHKHLLGFQQVPVGSFADTTDLNTWNTPQLPAIRYQLQFKYWISNGIRAGGIFDFHCAHRSKVLYNYAFKLYMLGGLNNAFMLKRQESGGNRSRGYQLSAVAGLGAHLFRFGGTYKFNIVYLEFRGYHQLTSLWKNGPEKDLRFTGIEAALGIKLVRESGSPF